MTESDLLKKNELLKQHVKSLEDLCESWEITYKKDIAELTAENDRLRKELESLQGKKNNMRHV